MSTKHTEGPWKMGKRYTEGDRVPDRFVLRDKHSNYRSDSFDMQTFDFITKHDGLAEHRGAILLFGDSPTLEANAALIEAAPDQQAKIEQLEATLTAAIKASCAIIAERDELLTLLRRTTAYIENCRQFDDPGNPRPLLTDAYTAIAKTEEN